MVDSKGSKWMLCSLDTFLVFEFDSIFVLNVGYRAILYKNQYAAMKQIRRQDSTFNTPQHRTLYELKNNFFCHEQHPFISE